MENQEKELLFKVVEYVEKTTENIEAIGETNVQRVMEQIAGFSCAHCGGLNGTASASISYSIDLGEGEILDSSPSIYTNTGFVCSDCESITDSSRLLEYDETVDITGDIHYTRNIEQ